MKKAKKTKASIRQTPLDQLVAQLRTMLHRQTTDVILAGNLLIESRKHLDHGEWQPWLAENFDLSLRTAQNYVAAAEYVARQKQIGNVVADFRNLAPSLLYVLAAGHFSPQEEAAILAATRKGRIDQMRANAICKTLYRPPAPAARDADDDDAADHDGGDAEAAAILDGPPPAVPPPALIMPPPDFALHRFDEAMGVLKQLMTKPSAQFAGTVHSASDLEGVENFIRAVVADRARKARSP